MTVEQGSPTPTGQRRNRYRIKPRDIGAGPGPLGNAEDRKVWAVGEFGLRIYAAKGYQIQIEYGRSVGLIQVDPGAREFRPFMDAMQQARDYVQGRR